MKVTPPVVHRTVGGLFFASLTVRPFLTTMTLSSQNYPCRFHFSLHRLKEKRHMKTPFEYGDLISRTSLATAEISLKYDVVISRVFVTRAAYTSQDSPFLMNVHKEQVAV